MIPEVRACSTPSAPTSPTGHTEGTPEPCSAGRDFVIYLWDLTALTPIATFTIEDFPIICALTANGDTAVVGDRRTLHLLRLEDGNPTA
jgi:hypothetical protein